MLAGPNCGPGATFSIRWLVRRDQGFTRTVYSEKWVVLLLFRVGKAMLPLIWIVTS